MKKFFALLLCAAVLFSLCSCGSPSPASTDDICVDPAEERSPSGTSDDIAFLTVSGSPHRDECFKALDTFIKKSGGVCSVYEAADSTDSALAASLNAALDTAPAAIVCTSEFSGKLSDTRGIPAILLDESMPFPNSSVCSVGFRIEEAAYLAGYAAIEEGYYSLGFIGDGSEEAGLYLSGFSRGADDAALALDISANLQTDKSCSNAYDSALGMYASGAGLIFVCGDELCVSALPAADIYSGRIIGAGTDKYYLSGDVLSSAVKNYGGAAVSLLSVLVDNGWVWPDGYAGAQLRLGTRSGAVGLATAETSWRFTSFSVEAYEALTGRISSGEIIVSQ